jgi:HEAT repeat protein
MPQTQPAASAVAPLLIELARSLRALQYLGPGHPTLAQALVRTAAVWSTGLRSLGALELEVVDGGFAVGGTEPVNAPALEGLAASFAQHRVIGLSVHPDVSAVDLEKLVSSLAEPAAAPEQGSLAERLKNAGVRHLALWTLPGQPASKTREGDASESASTPVPPVSANAAPARESDCTVELLRVLAELEPCDEPVVYKTIAESASALIERLLAAGNLVDCYRAALVYGRHVTDEEGRLPELRAAAHQQLLLLFGAATLRDFMLERACSAQASTSVQAIQLLACLVPDSAAALIENYGRDDAERRRDIARVLVAIGSPAVPLLARELEAESPGRVRRAVRLLGDMQNPDAVELLARQLPDTDSALQREVVRSLARIGTPRAIQILAETLRSGSEAALFAAGGLGTVRRPEAVRALLSVAEEKKGRSLELRREAIRNLGRIGDASALAVLETVLAERGWLSRRTSRELCITAAESIGKIGGEAARTILERQSRASGADVRQACREILRQLESPPVEQSLP